ncbi:GNAT family N-acetyltransferase [Paenibacillus sp. HJL G12]|uniref:GNAT family N-acetyltransferase n=1 Tax=Paenibacillus dendrobii TaxID=2691084 RepID=A0A7X3ING2_9BACL|nr:GNAT family protein [Paenibacillus dendrobii]MWV47154.1 GNAT family N-acetyltransferase [Paenibacillus dendrobii]
MKLETERLVLHTLDLDWIDAAAKQDTHAFEVMGYTSNGEWPGPDFYDALPFFRDLLIKNNGTRGFDSWIMVTKDNHEIVGGIGFLGEPDAEGVIEIGFATNESHQRKGYCFEAATRLIHWALGHDEVKRITARCELDNTASQHVLEKLGFQIERRDEEFIHWIYRG